MKKYRLTLIIVLILLVVSIFVLFRSSSSTIDSDDTKFAISDTAAVTKIMLADKQNHVVILKKASPGKWMVNDSFPALNENIQMLLETMMKLEIKQPVAKAARENILRFMSGQSTKVEIYQHSYRINLFNKIKWFPYEKKVKTYYVGFATQDNLGTFMLMEGGEYPFIVHIQGFNGFLTTRYSTIATDWRDHTIFKLTYNDIASVEIKNFSKPEESFTAIKKSPRSFELISLQNSGKPVPYDTVKLMDLFAAFSDIRFEAYVQPENMTKYDSIVKAAPYIAIKVNTTDGKEHILKTQLIKMPEDYIDQMGNPVEFDRDRLYAYVNNGKDLVLIQFFVFNKIFKPLSYYYYGNSINENPLNFQELKN
jgi:hypothetical protein